MSEVDHAQTPVIKLQGVSRTYGYGEAQVHALNRIDMSITEGEFVSIMGPSGSGKSTCMNILGCLDTPTSGDYRFMGVSVGTLDPDKRAILRRQYLGFVFQGFNLLARTSALENVELPLIYRGIPLAERHRLARKALDEVQLTGRELHLSNELSGGQQQRVAVARAIVTQPHVLFADEPTGNLDTKTSHGIMQLLARLNTEHGITIIIVTHEADIADWGNRLISFRDGVIESDTVNTAKKNAGNA